MRLNQETCYGTGLNVSVLLTFNFQKHNTYYLKGILAVELGTLHIYEYIILIKFYIFSSILKNPNNN